MIVRLVVTSMRSWLPADWDWAMSGSSMTATELMTAVGNKMNGAGVIIGIKPRRLVQRLTFTELLLILFLLQRCGFYRESEVLYRCLFDSLELLSRCLVVSRTSCKKRKRGQNGLSRFFRACSEGFNG